MMIEEMTDAQIKEGLVRASEQLEAHLSQHMAGNAPQSLADRMRQTASVSNVLQTTLKLQKVVQRFEDEVRARESEPRGLSARFEMKMSPEQKQWVLENGGAAKVRELIEQARQ